MLVDTEHWYFRATQRALAELGFELSLEVYRQHLVDGASSWDHARAIGIDETRIAQARALCDTWYQEYLQTEDIDVPGVEAVLARLGRRYRMAIVTTSKRQDFELIHRNRNIVPHMAFVLCSGEYPRAKPTPDPYLAALARFGAAPCEALVIEDSERGLRSAVAAQIPCVVVHNDLTAHQDLGAATHRIEALEGLIELSTTSASTYSSSPSSRAT